MYAYRYTLVYTYLTATLPYPTATEHLAPLHLVNAASTQKAKGYYVVEVHETVVYCGSKYCSK